MLQIDLLSAPAIDENPRPLESLSGQAVGLNFGTALPGGFSQCSFSMAMSESRAFEWYANRIGLQVLVHEGGQTVWEGRIQGGSLQPFGITITAEGYWTDLTSRNTYQWWGAAGSDDWKVPSFSTLITAAGLPVIPWSNQIWTAAAIGGGFYIALNKNDFLEDDAAAFVYILPVPPAGTDVKDFWQMPNMIRRIEADVEILNGLWSDASATRLEIEVYITEDPHAGTWRLEPITTNFEPDSSKDLQFAQGSYIGDGTTDGSKQITGLDFKPELVVIVGSDATEGHAVFRASNMSQLQNFTNGTQDDGIVSLDNDGFTVKDDSPVGTGSTNNTSVTYYWYALAGPNIEVGTYVGTGAPLDVPVAFDPAMVWAFKAGTSDIMFRQENMSEITVPVTVTEGATITIGSQGSGSLDPSTLQFDHTIDALTDVLFLAIGVQGVRAFDTVTWNGVPMTLITDYDTGQANAERIGLYYATNDLSGTHEISVTMEAGVDGEFVATAVNLKGVDTAAPFGTPVTKTVAAATSITSDSISGDYILDCVIGGPTGAGITDGASQTPLDGSGPLDSNAIVSSSAVGVSKKTVGGSTTLGWTHGSAINWAQVAVAVTPAQASKSFDFGVSAGEVDEITALGTLKFSIGLGLELNTLGTTYNYIAFKASDNLAFGKHTGDSTTDRLVPNADTGSDPVTPLTFNPEIVSIKADAAQQAVLATLGMGNFGLPYSTGAAETDTIDSLIAETGKFRVDDDARLT
jgi:hypothetical protein